MPLPPAPWLNPPDYTGSYLGGLKIGVEAGADRARIAASAAEQAARINAASAEHAQTLAQQQALAEMETQAKLKVADQQSRMEGQRLEIDNQYKQTMLQMNQQRLQLEKQKQLFAVSQAAQRTWAMLSAQREIKGGGNAAEVWSRYGVMATGSMGGMAGLVKQAGADGGAQSPTWYQGNKETGEPGHFVNPRTGSAYVPRSVQDPMQKVRSDILKATIANMERDKAESSRKSVRDRLTEDIRIKEAELQNLFQPGSASAGLPMPSSQSELKEGQLYQTGRGLARWDGEQFIPE